METVEFNGEKYFREVDLNVRIIVNSIEDNYNLNIEQIEHECNELGFSIKDLMEPENVNILMTHLLEKYDNDGN